MSHGDYIDIVCKKCGEIILSKWLERIEGQITIKLQSCHKCSYVQGFEDGQDDTDLTRTRMSHQKVPQPVP
jgi:NAD-dependent SIR2 family protein deacetylase